MKRQCRTAAFGERRFTALPFRTAQIVDRSLSFTYYGAYIPLVFLRSSPARNEGDPMQKEETTW